MSGAGQNKEGNSLDYPFTPYQAPPPQTHSLKPWGKADDYYILNQSFKAITQACLPPPDSLFLLRLCLVLAWTLPHFPCIKLTATPTHVLLSDTNRSLSSFLCWDKGWQSITPKVKDVYEGHLLESHHRPLTSIYIALKWHNWICWYWLSERQQSKPHPIA